MVDISTLLKYNTCNLTKERNKMTTINKEWQALLEDQFTGTFNNEQSELFGELMHDIKLDTEFETPCGSECRLWARAFAKINDVELEFPNEPGIADRAEDLTYVIDLRNAVQASWDEWFSEETV